MTFGNFREDWRTVIILLAMLAMILFWRHEAHAQDAPNGMSYYIEIQPVANGPMAYIGPWKSLAAARDVDGSMLYSHPLACHITGPHPPSNCRNTWQRHRLPGRPAILARAPDTEQRCHAPADGNDAGTEAGLVSALLCERWDADGVSAGAKSQVQDAGQGQAGHLHRVQERRVSGLAILSGRCRRLWRWRRGLRLKTVCGQMRRR